MKTITIPKRFGYPTLDITINGKEETFSSGVEISVEDSVAEAIENAIALAPKVGRNLSRFAQFVEGVITEVKGEELIGITTISPCLFYNYDGLKSIVIPDSVTSIGEEAFAFCDNLTNVTIGNGVTNIGKYAFEYCKALTSIEIPKSVTILESNVFKECIRLKKVTMRPISPPAINVDTFYNVPTSCVFEVPAESVEAYKKATNWSAFSNQMVAIKE